MKQINRVAVLGAGTMGAGIAAHLANAGRAVLLLDAVPGELTAAETSRGLTLSHPQVRNRLALAGLERLKTARPAALFSPAVAAQITPGNVEDDLARLADVDWIIEAVTERLEVKQSLLARVEAARRPGTIVSSNTSGLPIGQIAEGRSAEFKQHVLGTHFFNPPRQMKLLEVTPIPDTLPDVVETISQLGERDLGKGVVICKDTPNFIGNRIFTFDLTFGLLYALQHGYTIEEVDLLTGPLIGRPRTATFRLLDLVGIDVMALVSVNLYPRLPDDETREILRSPESATLIETMVERRWLGNKTGIGFYKQVGAGSAREYWPLDLASLEHRPPQKPQFPALASLERERDLGARLRALIALDDRAGQYLRAILGNLLGYTSRRAPEIADDVRSIDDAMRWGFSHALGPFEIWDRLGIPEGQRLASAADVPGGGAAAWVDQLLATGRRSFYEPAATPGRPPSYWNVAEQKLIAPADSPEVLSVAARKAAGGTVLENASASLVDLGDGVAALELHTKLNTLDDRIVELIGRSVEKVASDFRALVVTGQGEHFSAGANLVFLAGAIEAKDWAGIDRAGRAMQDAFLALRFSPRPVVVAPFGWALGGAAELTMSGARVVAAGETYIGQAEVGVGLLPGAGGCKELLRRIVAPVASQPQADTLPALSRVLELIAQGKVSGSALEAREWGFLGPADRIVMNPDHLLAAAKREALALADDYRPPVRGKNVYAAGRDPLAALKIQIYLFRESAYASAHDAEIARHLAYVLCGGELSEPQWVDEQYILNLERAAFIALCQLPKTQERIKHFLETGRTLRN
jgi:3-hydroxyacyl-CoA dehydrogenase